MEPLSTMGDVAAILRISRSTAFRMKKAQAWPHVRLGTEIRFTQADIEAIIQLNHQTPPAPKVTPNVGTRARRRNQK